jgi:peptidoglycan/LPS O-acetylase OafA/YrhL
MPRYQPEQLHSALGRKNRAACFAIIVSVSILSWRYFEKPMIQLGRKLRIHERNPHQEAATAK